MATVELTESDFEETITAQGKTVIVDFWAPWCAPCRSFAPVFEAASERHDGVVFAKVNTEDQQGIARALDIQAIPTLMIFRDAILLFQHRGMLPAKALDEVLGKVGELDMDDVRKKIAEEEAKAADDKAEAKAEDAKAEDAAPASEEKQTDDKKADATGT
jgi:thioredoxin